MTSPELINWSAISGPKHNSCWRCMSAHIDPNDTPENPLGLCTECIKKLREEDEEIAAAPDRPQDGG